MEPANQKTVEDQLKFRNDVQAKVEELSKMDTETISKYLADRIKTGLNDVEMAAFVELRKMTEKREYEAKQAKLKNIFEANQTKRIKSNKIFDKLRLTLDQKK